MSTGNRVKGDCGGKLWCQWSPLGWRGAFPPLQSPPGLLRHKETFLRNESHNGFLFSPEEPGCHSPSISLHLSPKAWFEHLLLPEPSRALLTGSTNVPAGLKPQEPLPRSWGSGAVACPADSAAVLRGQEPAPFSRTWERGDGSCSLEERRPGLPARSRRAAESSGTRGSPQQLSQLKPHWNLRTKHGERAREEMVHELPRSFFL